MRAVDTSRLLGVDAFLQVQSPSSLGGPQQFDDEVVQQSVDVTNVVPPRSVYVETIRSVDAPLNSFTRAALRLQTLWDEIANLGVNDLFQDLGLQRTNTDCWLVRATMEAETAAIANLNQMAAGVQTAGVGWAGGAEIVQILFGDTPTGTRQINAAASFMQVRNEIDTTQLLPMFIPQDPRGAGSAAFDSTIRMVTDAAGGGASMEGNFRFLFYFVQKGTPVRFAL